MAEDSPRRFPHLEDGSPAALQRARRLYQSLIDQRSDVQGVVHGIEALKNEMTQHPTLISNFDELYTTHIKHALRKELAKELGHTTDEGAIKNHHFDLRLGDTHSIDDKAMNVRKVFTKQLGKVMYNKLKAATGQDGILSHELLDRFGGKIDDEDSQLIIAGMLDDLYGRQKGSRESFQEIMRNIQRGALDDMKIGDMYTQINQQIEDAIQKVPQNVTGSLIQRLDQVYDTLDDDREKVIESIADIGGYKTTLKSFEKGPATAASTVITDLAEYRRLKEKDRSDKQEDVYRQSGLRRAA